MATNKNPPPAAPAVSHFSIEYKNRIMDQVNQCMTPQLLDLFSHAPASASRAVDFDEILDPNHWWRLFIDPQHWDLALQKIPHDPGQFYDQDRPQSEGFQHSMNVCYMNYLSQGELARAIEEGAAPGIWNLYQEVWKAATKYLHPDRWQPPLHSCLPDTAKSGGGSFGTTINLAADIRQQKLGDKMLVKEAPVDELVPGKSNACVMKPTGEMVLMPELFGRSLQTAVDHAFQDYKNAIQGAKFRKDQLYAIALLVRTLHVLHAFSDACGRVNVFTILPALLMRHGFGLTIGADRLVNTGVGVNREAIGIMFNGGFSVDEIARFLWVKQDFGAMAGPSTAPWSVTVLAEALSSRGEPAGDNDNDAGGFDALIFPTVPKGT